MHLYVALLLVFATVGQSAPGRPGCPLMCTYDYDPVCGTDGVTYSNKCKLNFKNCVQRTNVEIDHKGRCGDPRRCQIQCEETDDDEPVCGTDGQTHTSECELELYNCNRRTNVQVDYHGECRETESMRQSDLLRAEESAEGSDESDKAPSCNRLCTMEYNPVCGTNGQTYANACALRVNACLSRNAFSYAHAGVC